MTIIIKLNSLSDWQIGLSQKVVLDEEDNEYRSVFEIGLLFFSIYFTDKE